MSRTERVALIERPSGNLALRVQAELLGVSRASLYYRPVTPSVEEITLKHRIDKIFTAHPFYGSRRITAQLTREDFLVNRETVQRYMNEMAIAAIGPKPNLSKPKADHIVYPYLLGESWRRRPIRSGASSARFRGSTAIGDLRATGGRRRGRPAPSSTLRPATWTHADSLVCGRHSTILKTHSRARAYIAGSRSCSTAKRVAPARVETPILV